MIRGHFFGPLAALGVLAGAPSVALAQPPVAADTAAAATDTAAGAARVSLAPAQPQEGSIVRIMFQPAARGGRDSVMRVPHDSVRPDSLVRPDSVVRRDSIAGPDSLLRADTVVAIRATLFGEPLHFERDSADAYSAFAGIPVGAPDSVTLTVVVERSTGIADTIPTVVRVERGQYRMEKLAVAPAFGRPPDSALAARIARENRQAAEVSRRSHETIRLWTAPFSRPRNARVTSGFGDGREFNGRVQSRHGGLDLAGPVGAPVAASNRGVVALIGGFYYAGNAVYIDHGRGMVTAYFHLSKVDVAEGDTVEAGQRIGLVGATGRVTGPHLHWVARYGGVSVDPATLLPLSPIAGGTATVIATPPDAAAVKPAADSMLRPRVDSLGRPIPPPVAPPPLL